MLPVQAWPPGAPGRWGSPFSRPWLVIVGGPTYPCGLVVPKGTWLIHCRDCTTVGFRVRIDLGLQEPQPIRVPDPPPPPMWPPPPPQPAPQIIPPIWHVFTLVYPGQTTTVWSDGQNVKVCGQGRAMLMNVFS